MTDVKPAAPGRSPRVFPVAVAPRGEVALCFVAIPQRQRSLRIVPRRAEVPPSKNQLRFNRLTTKVAQLKRALHAWTQALPAIARQQAECHQRFEQHRAVVSDLVRLLDRMSADRSLTKPERAWLRKLICSTAADVLESGGADDLKAIYNKHSRGNYDAEAATENAMHAQMMKTILQDGFGFDFRGTKITSLDDLEQAAAEQLHERERDATQRQHAAEARKAKRKKSARQAESEARRTAETAQVGKTLQDVYRKLAMLLHPDHEQDPEERARKTLLMQEVNVAYDRKDLLLLLELQLRFEKVDEAQVNVIAEDRLVHFNTLLTEQARQLQQELAAVEEPWRIQLELPPPTKLTPDRILTALKQDLRELTKNLAQAKRDLDHLADPRRLKSWLRDARAAEAAEAAEAERDSIFEDFFDRF
jgi:hypothetical protein